MSITLRVPEISEKEKWLPLWQGYLTFYESALDSEVTDRTWKRFHDPDVPMHILVAADDQDQFHGFATWLFHPSTWSLQPYCYLEDLFVGPAARGGGLGRRLIEDVAARAKSEGCGRLYWVTQETNATARALYDRVARLSGFVQYRKPL